MCLSRKEPARNWIVRAKVKEEGGPEVKVKLGSSQLSQLACRYAMPGFMIGHRERQHLEASGRQCSRARSTRDGWEKEPSKSGG